MAAPAHQPLDDAFVGRLRRGVDNEALLMSDAANNHWGNLLQHFQGRTDYEIRGYIAENFRQNRWTGNEAWFTDIYVQRLFEGYDRTAFDASNRPALDTGARDSYNPSNAVRGYLVWSLLSKDLQGLDCDPVWPWYTPSQLRNIECLLTL